MKLSEYLKDRIPVYLIFAIISTIIIIFLNAFRIPFQLIFMIIVLVIIAVITTELWNYYRKKKFYNDVIYFMEELDKKYLLPETIAEPNFYDGKLLYNTLKVSNKSMHENVLDYKRQNTNFREYIEMWVHEAKIPLASIRLMCHNNPAIEDKFIAQIKRLEDNIDDVLYYSRSENPEKDYIIKEISLRKVVSNAVVKNREALQLIDAEIKTHELEKTVLTDAKWIEYVLNQLISNSIKYKQQNRKLVIEIFAEESDTNIILYFKDNGLGIIASDLPYIFEKSFTGNNGRTTAKSTGMGLYIVKQMCERLGLDIKVDSKYNEYTIFSISFTSNDYYKMQ